MMIIRTLIFLLLYYFSPFLTAHETILLMGPPGSGKGTFAFFAKQAGYGQISAGDVIREEILSGTDLGLKLESIVEKGQYIDADTLFQLVAHRVRAFIDQKIPFIIDGYGRSHEDWHRLNALLYEYGIKMRVILFEASEKVCLERVLNRLICLDCGYITSNNKGYSPGDLCPNCHKQLLSIRMNDNLNVTLKRLKTFHEEIKPFLIETYSKEEITFFCTDLPLQNLENAFNTLLFS